MYTVVGVAPAGLDYPAGTEDSAPRWEKRTDVGTGRVGATQAWREPRSGASRYQTVLQRLSPEFHISGASPVRSPTWCWEMSGRHSSSSPGGGRPASPIACVDVANLLLLRAASRARELAIRRAIGARYGDVVRQLVVESTVLAAAGGLVGFGCALDPSCAACPRTAELPARMSSECPGAPIAVAVVITLSEPVLLFGVVPAFAAARVGLRSAVGLDSRSGSDRGGRRRMREWLVGAQVAIGLVMVTLARACVIAQSRASAGSRP